LLVPVHFDRRLWVTRVILAGLVDRHFNSVEEDQVGEER